MTKQDLRREALTRRRALPETEVARRSAALWPRLLAGFPIDEWRGLHLFLPIARQHEPDTWPLIRQLWAEYPALQLAVPVVQPDGCSLRHYALGPETPLTPNRWDIPEPTADAPAVAPETFDAVLVPLLAFDETGHRVGYGKGFYDQFLRECRPDTLRIGVSLESPGPRIADAWAGDVRLHACITPEQLWRFGQ
ncbi:5-formyltetrahydrofolate cyclo-ligase [Hymenobacter lapidiphilus]|uniref:5-formyltetrahydrofolate cyclo-ligase n=1 Tax=Hymenobacter sp. CCM 8763 TaxID=2303334 RepID=UPI000E341957|nr:5-formyltetrahydrofolate cyclo-ligase [Hymenobacter sp. CCM 8763]RFP66842.1 5-formyltetrahydrofolate cyclo-ligase [Hymenobacter sp. CCM 8763]